jgi:hypothetical protein
MRFRTLVVFLALGLLLASSLWAQEGPKIFPLSEVHAGLKGTGRTVFEGNKIEEFQVEILGILKNALAPKHDVILARLSGGPLAETGVIAGMSGSPVYIDGRLLGAVALSFPFSKEPIAGITPIQEMLQVVPEREAPRTARVTSGSEVHIAKVSTDSGSVVRLIPDENSERLSLNALSAQGGQPTSFGSLKLPLRFGGFSPEAIDEFSPLLRRMGFEPMQGGMLAGTSEAPGRTAAAGEAIEPGSMISLLLVRGDLNLNVDCTVTYRQGPDIYACGHRVLGAGPVAFPFAPTRVLVTVPSLASSFKLDAPGQVVGTIEQDRFNAISGTLGGKAPEMIPVHLHVDSSLNKQTDYSFEMVQQPFISQLVMNLSLVTALAATERAVGPSTLELKGEIRLAGGATVRLEDVISSDIGAAGLLASAVTTPLNYLMSSGFADLHIDDIDLSIVSRNEKRVATLEQVWSAKSEVRPGDHVELTALLRLPGGEMVTQKIPLDIPGSITDKILSLVVGSGSSVNAFQLLLTPLSSTPRDLPQLVRALNKMRRNNRLYALLMVPQRSFVMQGDEYPSPPPSLLQTFLADPAVASSVRFSATSVVGDFETKPSPYVIQGQKMLVLKVVGPGT